MTSVQDALDIRRNGTCRNALDGLRDEDEVVVALEGKFVGQELEIALEDHRLAIPTLVQGMFHNSVPAFAATR